MRRAALLAALLAGCGGGGDDAVDAGSTPDAAPDAAPQFHAPVRIGNVPSVDPPRLALDSSGAGFAVWTQFDGRSASVWAARHLPATGWQAQELLENLIEHTDSPQIGVDDQGRAAAAWVQTDGFLHFNIWFSRWTAAGGWQAPALLEPDDSAGAGDVRLAMSPEGAAVAAWAQGSGGVISIFAASAPPGGPWSAPVLLETDPGTAGAPAVAIDAAGRAVVVWQQLVAGHSDVRQAVYRGSWSAPVTLDDGDDDAAAPRVALGEAGETAVVWSAGDAVWLSLGSGGAPPRPVRVDGRSRGTALRPLVVLERSVPWITFEWLDGTAQGASVVSPGAPGFELTTGARFPALAVQGRVLAAWRAGGIHAGWDGRADRLTDDPNATNPAVAISGDVALAVWVEATGVYAARAR